MPSSIRLLLPVVETAPRSLGAYAPREALERAIESLVREAAQDLAPRVIAETAADHELRTIVTKLEPDSFDRPFASAQVVIEVVRLATKQTVYTRKVESEVRRLIQPPVPLDDPKFTRTALGRATVSCLRSLFTAVADTFAAG